MDTLAYVILGLVLGLIGLVLIILALSKFNLFFMEIKEGRSVSIMRGGQLKRRIMVYRDHTINQKTGKITRKEGSRGSTLFSILGRHWIGIPGINSIREYTLTWYEYNEESRKMVRHTELTKYSFVVPYTYGIHVHEAEDKDGQPVNLDLDFLIKLNNLQTAEFGIDDWQKAIRGFINKQVNNVVGENSFKNLYSETDDDSSEEEPPKLKKDKREKDLGKITERILELNKEIPGSKGKTLEDVTGAEILQVMVRTAEFGGENSKELIEASTLKKVAEIKKQAAITESEGKATAIENVAAAKAKEIALEGDAANKVIAGRYAEKAKNKLTVSVAQSEAIGEFKGKTLVIDPSKTLISVSEGGES